MNASGDGICRIMPETVQSIDAEAKQGTASVNVYLW